MSDIENTEKIKENKEKLLNNNSDSDSTVVVQRSFLQRTFGEIHKGSLRVAIFTLVNTAVGTGMLALSQAIAHFGYVPGTAMLIIGAVNLLIGLYCFKFLIFNYPETKIYSQLVQSILGDFWAKVINWVFIIYIWGSLIAYILVAQLFIQDLSKPIFDHFEISQSDYVTYWSFWVYVVLATLCLPFNLKRTSDALKPISKYSFAIVFYISLVLIIQTPFYYNEKKRVYKAFNFDIVEWLKCYGNFIYSFNCIVNVFVVKQSLKNLNEKRLGKVFKNTIYFLFLFYSMISISGYLSFGEDSIKYDLILQRPALEGSNDVFMKIGIFFIILQVLIGFITHIIPIKSQFLGHFNIHDNNKINLIMTLFLTYSPMIVAWAYPQAKKIFSILGAFFGTMIIVTIPGLMMWKYFYDHQKATSKKAVFITIWAIFFTLFGFISGITLVYTEIAKK